MGDVRQKTAEYEYAGRIYNLTCNMNVLADVQEEYDGDLMRALRSVTSFKSTLRFLAAMLNDAAETQDLRGEDGKLLRVTARELGRNLNIDQVKDVTPLIMKLIIEAVPVEEDAEKPEQESGENQPKN